MKRAEGCLLLVALAGTALCLDASSSRSALLCWWPVPERVGDRLGQLAALRMRMRMRSLVPSSTGR
jgi:hypothetical protein